MAALRRLAWALASLRGQALSRAVSALPGVLYLARSGPFGEEIIATSRGFARLTGWEGTDFLRGLEHGAPRPHLRDGAEESAVEYRLRRPDGTWMRLRETLRRADDGMALGTLEALTAAGDTRRLAEDAMATTLAHELSQPLAVMSLAAENAIEALEAGPQGIPEAMARLRRIAAQADRAQAIATQLRAMGRLETATLETLALGVAVRGALATMTEALSQDGIRVEQRLPPALPAIQAQPVLLEQVLVNLLGNARDAMRAVAPGARRVTIGAERKTDAVVLTLQDSGPGLPPEAEGRLFEAFFTTKTAGAGTGLGLAFCRGVMQRFGGHIALGNAPGGGAIATLSFRRAAVAPGVSAVQAARAGNPVKT